jgi:hypothetical protein
MTRRDAVIVWVIYDRPRDFPQHVVVAKQLVRGGRIFKSPLKRLTCTLPRARRMVPPGLICIPHQPGENLSIAETWI